MFQFLENLLLKRKLRKRPNFELKYFGKYKNLVAWDKIAPLFEEYKSGDIIFEPIRLKISEENEKILYEKIDKSKTLSPQEKLETIMGLMMVLDGSFPKPPIMSLLEKVFGKDFVDTIEKKREEFKGDIATKKLTRLIKEWKKYPGLKNEWPFDKKFIGTDFDPLTKEAREHLKEVEKELDEEYNKISPEDKAKVDAISKNKYK